MQLVVIGVGHVGLVTAGALARWGHDVTGYDVDTGKLSTLLEGSLPFYEPGLLELIDEGVQRGRIRFTSDLKDALNGAEAAFVCVGTPPLPGGGPNLSFIESVGRDVAEHAVNDLVLVEKSTVPANTSRRLAQTIAREHARVASDITVDVASNPEFLREGSAVQDTLYPDRVVYGASTDGAREVLRAIYAPVVEQQGCPVVETDAESAELIKHASNAFLATRISFINAVAQICERVGADVEQVALGMGLDQRIGPHFLSAGLGYGGSCFPKDVDAFAFLARQVDYEFRLLDEVRLINEGQRHSVLRKLRSELWHLDGKTIAVLGAAFKPGTDDLREAPGIYLAQELGRDGATVHIYDPVALDGVRDEVPDAVLFDDPLEACEGAHAAIIATEWPEIRALTAEQFKTTLAYPIVVDGRNAFDPDEFIDAGIRYFSMGRRSAD